MLVTWERARERERERDPHTHTLYFWTSSTIALENQENRQGMNMNKPTAYGGWVPLSQTDGWFQRLPNVDGSQSNPLSYDSVCQSPDPMSLPRWGAGLHMEINPPMASLQFRRSGPKQELERNQCQTWVIDRRFLPIIIVNRHILAASLWNKVMCVCLSCFSKGMLNLRSTVISVCQVTWQSGWKLPFLSLNS